MNPLKRQTLLAALSTLVLPLAGHAQSPASSQLMIEALKGHYYMRGVRETGSELLLKVDGRFQWMMAYGNVDQFASGTWRVDKGSVILEATRLTGSPKFRLFTQEELRIRKPAAKGTWVAIVGLPRVGPAKDMEVIFEARSGKRVTAVSDRNGDAIVAIDEREVWTRAGLRRKGDTQDFQWFDVPADRVADHIGCFAVDDEKWIVPQAFERLVLEIREADLVSEDGRMRYSRQ